MDDYDEYNNMEAEEEDDDDDDDEEDDEKVKTCPHAQQRPLYARPMKVAEHLVLGAPQKVATIAQLAAANPIGEDLCSLLQFYFEDMGVVSSDGHTIEITPGHQVSLLHLRVMAPSYEHFSRLWSIDSLRSTINLKKHGR